LNSRFFAIFTVDRKNPRKRRKKYNTRPRREAPHHSPSPSPRRLTAGSQCRHNEKMTSPLSAQRCLPLPVHAYAVSRRLRAWWRPAHLRPQRD